MFAIGKYFGVPYNQVLDLPMPTYLFIREEYIKELERMQNK